MTWQLAQGWDQLHPALPSGFSGSCRQPMFAAQTIIPLRKNELLQACYNAFRVQPSLAHAALSGGHMDFRDLKSGCSCISQEHDSLLQHVQMTKHMMTAGDCHTWWMAS